MTRELTVLPNRETFVSSVARAAEDVIADALAENGVAHLALTGGTIGIAVLAGMARHDSQDLDWSRVHFWWGDERFVESKSPDRNANQARDALLGRLDVPKENVHEMSASDGGFSLDESAQLYSAELAAYSSNDELLAFDLTFLGIGPDSHVASLFPDHEDARKPGAVVSVRNSPKPPPERLSLSFDAICASKRVWIVAFGADKSQAVAVMFLSENDYSVPSSCVHGTLETRLWADEAAASALA